jgi:ABC-type phosphate/phosphonate transport system ATPase subunit
MEEIKMAELKLDNIYKIYDNKVTAVDNFNLHIEDKEFIVFVGPSGCGKIYNFKDDSRTGRDFKREFLY